MDKGETLKLLGLGLALVVLLLINKFDLLSASSRQALGRASWPGGSSTGAGSSWGGALLLALVVAVPTTRLIRNRRAQAAIIQHVANGPTHVVTAAFGLEAGGSGQGQFVGQTGGCAAA